MLFAASLHIHERRGITVGDLVKLDKGKDNAEKMLYQGKKQGLFLTLEKRKGKQMQYVISNYKYVLDKKTELDKREEIMPNDISLLLLQELSGKKYAFHRIVLQTTLCHLKDYEFFRGAVLSDKNKQKKDTVRLTTRRSCSYTVAPNGTVMIFIECTVDPFELHTPEGLIDFFSCCGQTYSCLQNAIGNRLDVVPKINEWYLKEFDCNKDLVIADLKDKYPMIDWTARGLIKVKHLGTIFQIYCKPLPDSGKVLRFESQHALKENKTVLDIVNDVTANNTLPFMTAEDLLKQQQEKKFSIPHNNH